MGNSCVLWWALFFVMTYLLYEFFWCEDFSNDESSLNKELSMRHELYLRDELSFRNELYLCDELSLRDKYAYD